MTAQRPSRTGVLILSALGVVFGDIGTSPLYALRECFDGVHAIPVTVGNVYGVLSLVFWSLIITVSIKYVLFVMRADNEGEGGILALVALVRGRTRESHRRILVAIGLFGAALLYGDGMITPAISVLSAVEGLSVATRVFEPYIVPITVVDPDRAVPGAAPRHQRHRRGVRADHDRVVPAHRDPRAAADPEEPRHPVGAEPVARIRVLRRRTGSDRC